MKCIVCFGCYELFIIEPNLRVDAPKQWGSAQIKIIRLNKYNFDEFDD